MQYGGPMSTARKIGEKKVSRLVKSPQAFESRKELRN